MKIKESYGFMFLVWAVVNLQLNEVFMYAMNILGYYTILICMAIEIKTWF